MIRLLQLTGAFAAGMIVSNQEIRNGLQVNAASALRGTAQLIQPDDRNLHSATREHLQRMGEL